jgi:hypothetical protein
MVGDGSKAASNSSSLSPMAGAKQIVIVVVSPTAGAKQIVILIVVVGGPTGDLLIL